MSATRSQDLRNLFELHLAVLLISTSGALGRFISLPPPIAIWWRCLLALFFLLIYCLWKKIPLRFDLSKDGFFLIASGILIAGHWIFYFYALQISNVAIGMLSLFTYPVLTALLEPLVFKKPFQWTHLGMGALVLVGIYFLAPELNLQHSHTQAIGFGILSALCYAIRNLLLKRKVDAFPGSMLMFYQVLIVVLLIWPVFLLQDGSAIKTDWPAIIALGLITTAIGHTLFVNSFQNFSITRASIISSNQPIYGIIIAMIFIGEIPGWNAVIGGGLILATVIWESSRKSSN